MRVVRAPIPFHKGQQLQFKSGSLLHFLCATIEPKRMVVWKMMPWTLPCLSSHVSFRRCLSCNSRMRYNKLYPPKKKHCVGREWPAAGCTASNPPMPTQTARANWGRCWVKEPLLCSWYAVEFLNFRHTLDAMLLAVPGFIWKIISLHSAPSHPRLKLY
jgi:hypothetical protein